MRHFAFLSVLFVLVFTGCSPETDLGTSPNIEFQNRLESEEESKIQEEMPDDQRSIPTPFKYYELKPVDQAVEIESLFEFREELLTNIKERNIDFLYKYFDEQGSWDFDSTTKEQLLKSWDEESWLELQKAVLLGGAFYDEEKTIFVAPYTFNLFPDEFDAYEFEVAIKDHVEVYMDKDVDSNIIEILNYTIVKRIYEGAEDDSYWKIIEMPDGRVGYVIGENIRSPIDYRVGFEKINNDWKVTFFLAGD